MASNYPTEVVSQSRDELVIRVFIRPVATVSPNRTRTDPAVSTEGVHPFGPGDVSVSSQDVRVHLARGETLTPSRRPVYGQRGRGPRKTTQALMGEELGPAGMGPPEAPPVFPNGWVPRPREEITPDRPIWYGSECCTRWPRANEVAINCVCGQRIHEGCLTDLLGAYRHDGCPVCVNATTNQQRRDSMTKNLTDGLVQVRTNITALDTNLSNQVRVKVEALNESLAAVRVEAYQNISSVTESLAAVRVEAYQNISSVNESLAAVRVEAYQNISSVNESLAAVRVEAYQNISSVDESLADVKAEANQNISSVNMRLAENITGLNDKLDKQVVEIKRELLSDVGGLNSTMQQMDNRSTNNLNQLNSVADATQKLLLDVGGLNSTLQHIDYRSADNLNQLNSVRSRVNDLNGNLSQVRTTVNHHTANITALDTRTAEEEHDYVYSSYKRSYIRLVKMHKSWDYAQIHCGAAGEYLLTFSSTSEATWFKDLKAGRSDWGSYTWIGLRGSGSYYRWYGYNTGSLASSSWDSYWSSGQPDFTNFSYCGLSNYGGSWHDTYCYTKLFFFCEKR